jgi:pyruvate dehydrogenase complex dehydrogenase (E1) component
LNENDFDPIETNEWLEAIDSVIEEEGIERASFLLSKLANKLTQEGAIPSYNLTTPFRNSINAWRSFYGKTNKISHKVECTCNGFKS